MNLETFEETIRDQLTRLGGEVVATVKPEKRGYTVKLSVDSDMYDVTKFYTESDVATYSPQLVRAQVTNLYKALCQKVLDRNVGEGVLCLM